LDKFEFIFVTSTRPGKCAQEYAAKYPWVRVIYRDNLAKILKSS